MRLPPELFAIVGLYADVATLRTIRLVSRLICELVTPLAWSDIMIRPRTTNLISRIQPYIHARADKSKQKEDIDSLLNMSYLTLYPRRCSVDVTELVSRHCRGTLPYALLTFPLGSQLHR
jgi:hypothetical protein